jgi:flagellar hook-associated protein 1 FlgK
MSSSISGILSIARTAISAHQTAVQVTSQNISNAQTEGYSRQRVMLKPGVPLNTPIGSIGTGVRVHDVMRVRDGLLDASYRREAGNAASFGVRKDLLTQVEGVFGEPSDAGLASTLDAFWSAWGDLANNPTSATARGVVQQRGAQVAFTLNTFSRQLEEQGSAITLRLQSSLDELNARAKEIAGLNDQIVATEVNGTMANDLRDARDRAIDAMAQLAPTRVIERPNGSVAVLIGNATMVDGADAKALEMKTPLGASLQSGDLRVGNPIRIGFKGSTSAFPQVGGAVGAMLDVYNSDLPGIANRLDTLTGALVEKVNETHNPPPGAGVPFFDPLNTSARNVSLSSDVQASPSVIAAGTSGPGDNSIARALAAFRDTPLMDRNGDAVADTSFATYYRNLVTDVALEVSSADRTALAHETLASQADMRRASTSGVSIDEELILLMHHQQAYTAATRLVNVADEMMQSILNMV